MNVFPRVSASIADYLRLREPRTSRAATARIQILPDEKIGVISPGICGTSVLTVVNSDAQSAQDAETGVSVGKPVAARVLTSTGNHAHNSFDHPDSLQPADRKPGGPFTFPQASVTRLDFALSES